MTWTGAAILAVALGAAYFLLARRLLTVTVDGESMVPALPPRMDALVRKAHKAKTGDIVVVAAPDPLTGWLDPSGPAKLTKANKGLGHWWVKRVAAVGGERIPDSEETVPEGHYYLLSDNPAGEDSRRHGTVPASQLLGVVMHHWPLDEES
ncbi:S26 family signal peptidase [Salininema proteolyticum]|uniref:S26 family signal peptidase n=1 Tax=Salininema proteolyticum TaxID=1607685 RepID=A0ABV8U167_9ACTN